MRLFDRRTLAVLVTALIFAAALWIVWAARRTLLAFLFAIFFAYLLEPLVERLERAFGGRRFAAIAITYLILLVIVAASILSVVPRLTQQGPVLTRAITSIASQISTGELAQTIGREHGWSWKTRDTIGRWLVSNRDNIQEAVQAAGSRAAELSANVGWILLIPILSLFLLKDKAMFAGAVLSFLSDEQQRTYWRAVLSDLDRMLAQYIRAQLLLCLAAMVAYTTFLAIMRFPYALGLGVLAGVLEFIPFVGPAITAALLFLVGFFSGYPHWFIVLVFVGGWRIVQDYVNAPYLMGEGLELHPMAAIFGVLAGGEIAGIPGMFLSIPVIAAVRILWRNRGLASRRDEPVPIVNPSL